ncbi:MAG: hypothetical protein PVH89_04285 [Gammaproteobacteria bacterium]|jgi:hypothetical protein
MKFLVTFLAIVAAAFLLAAAIPVLTVGLAFLICFGGFFIWLLPILIIATSDKTTGAEKVAWILAIIFLSWFAWIFYFLLAPIKEKPYYRRSYRYDRDYRYD